MDSTTIPSDETAEKCTNESKISSQTMIREFIKRNLRRFLFAGIFLAILSVLALTPGIGYTAKVDMTTSQVLYQRVQDRCYCVFQDSPRVGYFWNGSIHATFNRFLYPINHMFGSEISTTFVRKSGPFDYQETSVRDSIITETLLSRFPLNTPFFFVIGYLIAVGLGRANKKIKKSLQ